MRCTRALGVGLLLGLGPACGGDKTRPEDPTPTVESSKAEPSKAEPSKAEPPKQVLPAPPAGAWVLVDQQRLFSAPNRDSPLAVESKEAFRVAEVVAPAGEFVELRTAPAFPGEVCGSGANPYFDLHFFAELDALQPVLRRRSSSSSGTVRTSLSSPAYPSI